MRVVPQAMTDAWHASMKTGDARRPVVRATVQKLSLNTFFYDTALAPGGDFAHDRHRTGVFASAIFGEDTPLLELRNIESYTWTRSRDQDVATCTITLLNSDLTPIGDPADTADPNDFDQPGYFTYNRGQQTVSANRWGFTTDTGWQAYLVPDRMIKTYEGYGCDMTVMPAQDPNLVQSGTWLIDKVDYTHDGQITLTMRDVGRLLLDMVVFPPVVPYAEYPLSWEKIHSQQVTGRAPQGGSYQIIDGTASSSNDKYIGLGLSDPPYSAYVSANGGVNGHTAADGLHDNDHDFWWSTGQTSETSKVWWEAKLSSPKPVAAVRIHPRGGPYRIYISLEGPNGWYGKKKIPYHVTTEGVDLKAGIPFVETLMADRNDPFDVVLRRKYKGVKRVRLTFSHLQDTNVGNYPFRAGLRDLKIYTAGSIDALSFGPGTFLKVVGNYSDYSNIVKWAGAWCGWYWPPHDTGMDFIRTGQASDPNGGRTTITYDSYDPALPSGRCWGDFMMSGTTGDATLTVDLFDKKPVMDMINYVRDILGFIFFIDETGGIVWRMPNLHKLGNYLSPGQLAGRTRSYTTDVITLDETDTLLSYSTALDSKNCRERIFVANTTGKVGTVIKGFHPYNVNFRRIAGWTDQHFGSKQETRIMADMIAAQAMFDFRRGKALIPGYPAIQVDDQVRIFERVTNETYYHYVVGITCNLDNSTGEFTYELETHWLGERPSDAWVIRVDELDNATQAYLNTMGAH